MEFLEVSPRVKECPIFNINVQGLLLDPIQNDQRVKMNNSNIQVCKCISYLTQIEFNI